MYYIYAIQFRNEPLNELEVQELISSYHSINPPIEAIVHRNINVLDVLYMGHTSEEEKIEGHIATALKNIDKIDSKNKLILVINKEENENSLYYYSKVD